MITICMPTNKNAKIEIDGLYLEEFYVPGENFLTFLARVRLDRASWEAESPRVTRMYVAWFVVKRKLD